MAEHEQVWGLGQGVVALMAHAQVTADKEADRVAQEAALQETRRTWDPTGLTKR